MAFLFFNFRSMSLSEALANVGELKGVVANTLKQSGFTILLVEQNFRFASRVADRFYVMDHGVITHGFPVGELDARMDSLHETLGV